MLLHLVITILLNVIGIIFIYSCHKQWKDQMLHKHILIMAVTGLSSLIMGIISGLMLDQMALASLLAVLYGVLFGVLAGKPFHIFVAMSGAAEGVMGGIMGAMTGVMMMAGPSTTMLLFTLYSIFAFALGTVAYFSKMEKESVSDSREQQENPI
ncbi:hypothetical protein D7Z54_26755 [Salibacterium salarium]|uniref:Uncharacterized protein n=1 Tax=Salibacterium salarium TaxID=284579 RepID=A0A3R9P3L4_9BACI|nr:hypothetical protein [Salibacterium salarium]RSL30316.1 hypothetical protein D7Z54_26755 [Salibacterium salarium]